MKPGDTYNKFQTLKKSRKIKVDPIKSKEAAQNAEVAAIAQKKRLAIKGLV